MMLLGLIGLALSCPAVGQTLPPLYGPSLGNTALKEFGLRTSPLSDEGGMLRHAYSDDGLHPKKVGYAALAPLYSAGVVQALAQGER